MKKNISLSMPFPFFFFGEKTDDFGTIQNQFEKIIYGFSIFIIKVHSKKDQKQK
jgi:hypothetical protein